MYVRQRREVSMGEKDEGHDGRPSPDRRSLRSRMAIEELWRRLFDTWSPPYTRMGPPPDAPSHHICAPFHTKMRKVLEQDAIVIAMRETLGDATKNAPMFGYRAH